MPTQQERENAEKIMALLCSRRPLIPRRTLATYASVGERAGLIPGAAGRACYVLGIMYTPEEVPYHRIVGKDGWLAAKFSAGGPDKQAELLEAEGHQLEKRGKRWKVLDFENHLAKPTRRRRN